MTQPCCFLRGAIQTRSGDRLCNFLRRELGCRKLKLLGRHSRSWIASVAPALRRGPVQACLRNERAHPPPEASQTDLTVTQRTDGIGAGSHARLYAFNQRLVFDTDPAIDPPVEIARGLH